MPLGHIPENTQWPPCAIRQFRKRHQATFPKTRDASCVPLSQPLGHFRKRAYAITPACLGHFSVGRAFAAPVFGCFRCLFRFLQAPLNYRLKKKKRTLVAICENSGIVEVPNAMALHTDIHSMRVFIYFRCSIQYTFRPRHVRLHELPRVPRLQRCASVLAGHKSSFDPIDLIIGSTKMCLPRLVAQHMALNALRLSLSFPQHIALRTIRRSCRSK